MSAYHGIGLDSANIKCSSGKVSQMKVGSVSELIMSREI